MEVQAEFRGAGSPRGNFAGIENLWNDRDNLRSTRRRLEVSFAVFGAIMVNTLFLPELREMLADENDAELQEFCMSLNPGRTA